ncbi:DNA polymerase III subunit beta [Glutamicibacter arilaitensis]|uniref:DNA polymerase III subunit beta n=1 Tax=Glutamicibacter arilaitensis TaxID=256701 RepID=UPI003FCFD6C3
MKFTIAPADLKEAVRFALTAMASRPTSPIMGGILFTVVEGAVTASGSDYEKVASLTVSADVSAPGEALLNGLMLSKAIGKFRSSKPVTVIVESKKAHLSQGATKFNISAMPAEDYPRDLVGKTRIVGTVKGEDLAQLIRSAGVSTDNGTANLPVIECAHVELGQKLAIMSTDRYQLSLGEIDWEPTEEMEHGLSVHGDWIRSVGKTIAGHTELFIGESNGEPTRFGVTSGAYSTSVSLTAGDYPKIRRLFTNNESTPCDYNLKELTDAIDVAAALLTDKNIPVLVESDDGVTTISGGADEGDSTARLTGTLEEQFRFAVNPQRILSVIRVTDGNTITITPNGNKVIWVTSPEGNTDHLVMPVRLPEKN